MKPEIIDPPELYLVMTSNLSFMTVVCVQLEALHYVSSCVAVTHVYTNDR